MYANYALRMPFEWADAKDRANQAKHGLSFDAAQAAFFDPRRFIPSGSPSTTGRSASSAPPIGGKEWTRMSTAKSKAKGPILDADGYEDAPPDIALAIATGTPVRADFLPPPSGLVLKSAKRPTTIRLDADVLEWFQAMGKGYQTKINAVLRAYKAAHHG